MNIILFQDDFLHKREECYQTLSVDFENVPSVIVEYVVHEKVISGYELFIYELT